MGTYQIMEFRCRPGIIQYVLYEFGILYKTLNAIVELELPYEYGITSMKRNGGIIHNRGIEYTLTFTPIQKRDYALSVQFECFQELE